MIRVRKPDGSCITLSDPGTFVELVNDVDNTVMLVFLQVQPGVLMQIRPGTNDARRYETMFSKQNVNFAKIMVVRESA